MAESIYVIIANVLNQKIKIRLIIDNFPPLMMMSEGFFVH